MDREIAAADRREKAMQAYFDRMTELLLDKDFDNSKRLEKILAPMQTRTLTVLRDLDTPRKESIIRFLSDAKLITTDQERSNIYS